MVRQGLELGVGLGSRMEVLGLGAISSLQRLYLDLGWAMGWDKGLHCSGGIGFRARAHPCPRSGCGIE